MPSPARKIATNPAGVPPPIRGYYSNCVRVSAGPLLFVAGQVGIDAQGKTAAGAAAQAEQALVAALAFPELRVEIEAVAVAP